MENRKRVFKGISGMILMLVAAVGTSVTPHQASAQCTVDLIMSQNPGQCQTQVFLTAIASDPLQSWAYYIDGALVGTGSSVMVTLTAGYYTASVLVVTDQNCTAVDDIGFWITNGLSVSTSNDTVGCQEEAYMEAFPFGGSGSYSYSWSPSVGLSDPNAAVTHVGGVHEQTYVVTVTDNSYGCTATDSVTVSSYVFLADTLDLCSGSTTIDLGPGATAYHWLSFEDTLGNSTPLNYPTTQQVIVVQEPGHYFAYAIFPSCGALTSLVTVETCQTTCFNVFNQTILQQQCGDHYQFVSTGTGVLTSWSWDFGDGTTSSMSNPSHAFTTGTYEVTLTTTTLDGCTAVSSQTFMVNNGISLTMSNDTIGCQEAAYMGVFPSGGSGNYSYSWLPSVGLSHPNAAATHVEGVHEQTYVVTVTDDASSCAATDSVTVSSYVAHFETLELCHDSVLIDLGPGAQFYNLQPLEWDQQQQSVWTSDTGTYFFYAMFPNCGAITSLFHVVACADPCTDLSVSIYEDTVACNGGLPLSSTIVGGSGQYHYEWHPASAMSDPNAATPWMTVTQNTYATVEVQDLTTGCVAYDSIFIYANHQINETIELCVPGTQLMVDPGSLIYSWNYTDQLGNNTQLPDQTNQLEVVGLGTYV